MTRCFACLAAVVALCLGAAQSETKREQSATAEAKAREMLDRGAKYLLSAQARDGSWAGETGPGISAICLKALAQTGNVGPKHDAVERGVEFVLRFQREKGGIHAPEGMLKNYETSVALSMLAAVSPEKYKDKIAAAQKFLTENQFDESESRSIDDPFYGGAGYGRSERPDLSNTQIMLDALKDSGLPKDDPAYQKALIFISRCQMLGEKNDQAFARGSTQGGFIYSPANNGESKAGEIETDGRKELRAYGSMTYAGFKSMIYAGLTRDDPRVRAALEWIRRNWTLNHNPNMPEKQSLEGLYYYYHTFARALGALGEDRIKDHLGREHDWRAELVEKLAALQKSDGSWVNDADRWMEGKPVLTTAYAMLALQAAYPPSPEKR